MNFFWGDSEKKDKDDDGGGLLSMTSTFDLLSLPTSEAGAFYEQLNKEIEGLRAKVDSQLRDMVEASRKDITVLENKLKEIQSGEESSSMMTPISRFDLTSLDSNVTEPAANLSRAPKSRARDCPLSPSEEAKLLGILKIGSLPEGREDDENDDDEASTQVDSQDRILQTRTRPENTNTDSFASPHESGSIEKQRLWNVGPTVNAQESATTTTDAIDKARQARYTPTGSYCYQSVKPVRNFSIDDKNKTGSAVYMNEIDADKSLTDTESLSAIRDRPSLIDADSDDMNSVDVSEYGAKNTNTCGLLSSRTPTLSNSTEDVVLQRRLSMGPNRQELVERDITNGNIINQASQQETKLAIKTNDSTNQKRPQIQEHRQIRRDPPIDKKKVPSNPYYENRYEQRSNFVSEERSDYTKDPGTIRNVRSQSLTPTALGKYSNNRRDNLSPTENIRSDSAPPIASSVSLARMDHSFDSNKEQYDFPNDDPYFSNRSKPAIEDKRDNSKDTGFGLSNVSQTAASNDEELEEKMRRSAPMLRDFQNDDNVSPDYGRIDSDSKFKSRNRSRSLDSVRIEENEENEEKSPLTRSYDISDVHKESQRDRKTEKGGKTRGEDDKQRIHLSDSYGAVKPKHSGDSKTGKSEIRLKDTENQEIENYEDKCRERKKDHSNQNYRNRSRSLDGEDEEDLHSLDSYHDLKPKKGLCEDELSDNQYRSRRRIATKKEQRHADKNGNPDEPRHARNSRTTYATKQSQRKSRSEDSLDDHNGRDRHRELEEGHISHAEQRQTRTSQRKVFTNKVGQHRNRDSDDENEAEYPVQKKQSASTTKMSTERPRHSSKNKSFDDIYVQHYDTATGEKHCQRAESRKRTVKRNGSTEKTREEAYLYDSTLQDKRGSGSIDNDDEYNTEISSALIEWSPPKETPPVVIKKAPAPSRYRRQPSPEKLMRTRMVAIEHNSIEKDRNQHGRFFGKSPHNSPRKVKEKKTKQHKLSVETEQPPSFSRTIVPHVAGEIVAVPSAQQANYTTSKDLVAIQKTIQNGEMVILSEVQGKLIKDPYGDEGRYTGIMMDGLPHGEGTMHYSDGRSYFGEWRNGRWHGHGRAKFVNGDLYIGRYERDRRHGKGRYEWADGRIYDGEFVRNQRHGRGFYTWPDGASYSGEFVDGQRHGEGCYRFADGSVYKGEWQHGKYDGIGECVWASGRKYHGEWRAGKAQGYGVEFRADGTIRHQGEWKKDKPVRRRMDP